MLFVDIYIATVAATAAALYLAGRRGLTAQARELEARPAAVPAIAEAAA